MLKQLLALRDFCFVWATKQYGEDHAVQEHKIKLAGLFGGYYMALHTILPLLNYKAGNPFPIPAMLGENVLAQFVFGLAWLLLPYYLFSRFLFRQLAAYPIDKHMPAVTFKRLARKAALFFLAEIVLMMLILFSLDRLLPTI